MEEIEIDTSKIILPPPMKRTYEAIELSDPTIPGEIKIDQDGKLLKEWFRMEGPLGSLVDQYDNFITNVLPQIVSSRTLSLPIGTISFENVFLTRPSIKTITGRPIELYPNMCRDSDYSYTGEIYVDVVLNKGLASEERITDRDGKDKKTFLGKIPVMLGSELDWLKGKSDSEKKELAEGIGEESGYFIIKGREKIILIQEKLRPNRFFVFNSTSKGDVVCKITNNTLMGSTQITMARGKKSGGFKLHLGFMKRNKGPSNKLGNTISVFQIYRMLGVNDPREILKYISLFAKPEHMKKIFVALQPTFVKLSKIGDDIEYLSKKMGLGNIDYSIRKSDIMKDLINQLFPQIPADQITEKLYMLSMMTVRLVESLIGVRELDDRDSWSNKQLVTAGKSLELLFASIWREALVKAQKDIDSKKLNSLKGVERVLDPSFVTDNFIDSFTANKWGVSTSYMAKDNITDILNRQSVLAVYSHLTKINTPASRKGKSTKARMVQMSQLGYVDPAETQEGENCGLVKNTAMTTYISLDRPETVIWERLGEYVSSSPSETEPNPFILNGIFKGWVNGEQLRQFSVSLRRKLIFEKDTAIVLERDGIFNIFTDSSRPTRPLMIVENGELVIEKKNLWKADFVTLLREGCVEYVDAWEQETIMLAQTMKNVEFRKKEIEMALREVKKAEENLSRYYSSSRVGMTQSVLDYETNKNEIRINEEEKNLQNMLSQAQAVLKELTEMTPYTHSEMDPTALMGMAVSIIPLAETNPGPRLTYQAGMGKQSLGIYHSAHGTRFDTGSKLLAYPSRPMFETQMNQVLGLNELPAGEMVIVAITTYGGFSQEDAIIMAKGAIDRGLFRSVVYKTYKSIAKKKNEKFARPEIDNKKEARYSAIGENGLPRLGSVIKEGDCVIGKVRKNAAGKWENISTYMELRQEGIVDRVLVTNNQEGERVVKVKIRQVRKPILGDKFSCYTPDHEVLTLNRSWIPINELTLEDRVATLIPDENGDRLVYQNPSEIQSYDYEGEMYHIETQQIDLCVTPNHRMYVKLRNSTTYTVQTAEEIDGKRVNYKKDARYIPTNEVQNIQLQAYNESQEVKNYPIIPFCVLFGIFIAEGWVSSGERFPHRIDIAANKPRVRHALKLVCEELNLKYSNGSNDKKWYIWDLQVGEYLRQFSLGAVNKFLPEWCFNLSQENSRILLESLMLGDGHKTKQTGSYTYYTSSEKLAKDVTQLALHAGWSANSKIRFEEGSESYYAEEDRIIRTTTDGYAVPIIRTKNNPQVNHGHVHQQSAQTEEWVDYQGKVHCCTVPSGIIYVRRNGKPVWCGNSRYAQKGTIGMILSDEDMPFTAGGVRPDIVINTHCFTKDTPVSTLCGYSKRISNFSQEGGESVWTWNLESQTFTTSMSLGMESKGIKKLINVYLEDGRVMKCTPDHKFLTINNDQYEWVEAQHLENKKVLCGLEMPLDKPEEDIDEEWSLTSADYTFDMRTPLNREKSLAFARILGYTLTDGCVSERDDLTHGFASTLNMGHDIDAKTIQDDIFLITGKRPVYSLSKGTVNIRLPASLSGAIGKLPGVQSGKRASQAVTLPHFINYPDCPKSVIREFLGGMFGGDGIAPWLLDRKTKKTVNEAPLLIETGFIQTTQEGYVDDLKRKMENILELMGKLGVQGRLEGPHEIYYNSSGYDKPKDGIPRFKFVVHSKTNSDFGKYIGFRYCIQKTCRLAAAQSYWRYQEEIVRQHDWVVNRTNEIYESGVARQRTNKKSIPVALEMARKELIAKEPVINEYYSLSNVKDIHNRRSKGSWSSESLSRFLYKHMMDAKVFFKKIGCLDWFQWENQSSMEYIVKRNSMTVPGFQLNVIGLRDAGEEETFDIGVHEHHNFLAHGTVVHNCLPSRMTIGKLIEIITSKVAAFTGERVNATSFRNFDTEEFMRNLVQYGYSSSGKERMYSGFTGKPLEALIFTGPCYYQALKHQVMDKIQMRGRGGITQLTHQPVSGLKRGGGQRIGEMERDAIIAHGASAFGNEALCKLSDPYEAVFCSTCGSIAITAEEKMVCRKCDQEAKFGTCTIPYSFKLLTQLLAGANLSLKFKMKEVPK